MTDYGFLIAPHMGECVDGCTVSTGYIKESLNLIPLDYLIYMIIVLLLLIKIKYLRYGSNPL